MAASRHCPPQTLKDLLLQHSYPTPPLSQPPDSSATQMGFVLTSIMTIIASTLFPFYLVYLHQCCSFDYETNCFIILAFCFSPVSNSHPNSWTIMLPKAGPFCVAPCMSSATIRLTYRLCVVGNLFSGEKTLSDATCVKSLNVNWGEVDTISSHMLCLPHTTLTVT